MSTNYYIKINECPHCGRCEELIHIGKRSCGWPFTFHGYETKGVVDVESWKEFIKNKHIIDEYDQNISYEEMLEIVDDTYENAKHTKDIDFLFCDFC